MSILLWGALLVQAALPLIDLVAEPPKYPDLGATEGRFGGIFQHSRPKPQLPLRIRLESIQPGKSAGDVVVQILVENTGKEPYALPVGRDGEAAFKPANRGRHQFWFSLRSPKEKLSDISGLAAFSSTDIADSLMMVPAGGVVRVRYAANISRAVPGWKREGKTQVEFWASCHNVRFEDNPDKYVVDGWEAPPPVLSDNAITLTLP